MRNKLIALSVISSGAGCVLHIFAPGFNIDPYFMCIGLAAAIVAICIPKRA